MLRFKILKVKMKKYFDKFREIKWTPQLIITVFVFSLVFSLFFFIPLIFGLNNQIIANPGDAEQSIWQAKNFKNMITSHSSMVKDSYFGIDTPYTYTPNAIVQSSVYLIINFLTNNVFISYNLMVGFFLFLNFVSMYAVLKLLKRSWASSLIFSILFAFCPPAILHATGHISLFILFTIPLFLYALLKIKETNNIKFYILASILLPITFYIHEYYGFGLFIIALIFLVFNFKFFFKKELIKKLSLSIIIMVILIAPFLQMNYTQAKYDKAYNIETKRSIVESNAFASTPVNYFFPPNDSFLYSKLTGTFNQTAPSEKLNYIGLISIILLIVGFVLVIKNKISIHNKEFWFYAVTILFFCMMSFGAYIILNDSKLYLPVSLGYQYNIPPFDSMRAYGRFGVFALAVLFVGLSFFYDQLAEKKKLLSNPIIVSLILIFCFFDVLSIKAIPQHTVPIPSIVSKLDNYVTKDEFIANVPFESIASFYNSTGLLFQTVHNRNVVNGYGSFTNPNWESKIQGTYIKCFHFFYYTAPECDTMTSADLQKDKVKVLIYEKNVLEHLPAAWQIPEDQVRNIIQERLRKVSKEIIYEDDNYIFGLVY